MRLVILKKVAAFIETLQKPTQAKWLRQLTLLEQYGENLGMPHVKHIAGGMGELRVRGPQEVRAFFVIKEYQAIVIHAFVKKTQKTPQREIDTAQKQLSNFLTET